MLAALNQRDQSSHDRHLSDLKCICFLNPLSCIIAVMLFHFQPRLFYRRLLKGDKIYELQPNNLPFLTAKANILKRYDQVLKSGFENNLLYRDIDNIQLFIQQNTMSFLCGGYISLPTSFILSFVLVLRTREVMSFTRKYLNNYFFPFCKI